MIDYLLIGHIASDIVPQGRAIGGTVGYAAYVAQAFGLRVGIITSTAKGEPLLAHLAPFDVTNVEAPHTTTFENIYTDGGRVQYVRAVAAPLTQADIPPAWRHAPLVHIAPIADEVQEDIITRLTGKVMLTPQGWMRHWADDQCVHFKRWYSATLLQRADLVVISEEDIAEAPEISEQYSASTHCLVITQGERGGEYRLDGQHLTYTTPQTQATDPTGAGDVFGTALFAAWHRLDDIHKAVHVAAQVAARATTQRGIVASAPPADWLEQIIATA